MKQAMAGDVPWQLDLGGVKSDTELSPGPSQLRIAQVLTLT